MKMGRIQQTRQLHNTRQIYGFDIETYDKNRKFYCASVFGNKIEKTFYEKQELINYFKTKKFKHSIVAATNLQFDFFGTFHDAEEVQEFNTLFRGSDLLSARSYIINKEFSRKNTEDKKNGIIFLDTLNYAKQSVEQLGKILKIPKLNKPKCIGRLPRNNIEKQEMEVYNMRDSEISKKYIDFLYDSFERLGATPKITIASTSMSLYKNKYLKQVYYQSSEESLIEQFKSYYGGRTEAFNRGRIKKYYYYDYNSLYPSVMCNKYPDPNTQRESNRDTTRYLEEYEGITKVTIGLDYLEKPLLPVMQIINNQRKLIFPTGTWTGYYTNVELRQAIKLGYEIQKVHKSIYFKQNCYPFKTYVKDLYNLRMDYKQSNNPMEKVVKLFMNSLYGKFGQKFLDRDNWIPMPKSYTELLKYKTFERIGNFLRIKQDNKPANFCIPIWASYTTAMARIKLHKLLLKTNAIYCDTDSVITKDDSITDSKKLGELKLEDKIIEGVIIKPKFYGYKSKNGYKIVAKGIGTRLSYGAMLEIIQNPKVTYQKFMKLKESIRRGYIPNYIMEIEKNLTLEDNKRQWYEKFNINGTQASEPIKI